MEYPDVDTLRALSTDELRHRQEVRLGACVATAWRTPFYIRRWGDAGIGVGDIRGLDDLHALPIIEKADIMAALDRRPPFGDLNTLVDGPIPPRVLHTTSGTTGTPQPVIWGAWSREVQNVLLARLYRWLGVGADDVVHSVYGHGLINGGHYMREAVVRYLDALFVSAGTGAETPSAKQVHLMKDFGATVLIGFGDYLRKLADVAHDEGLMPGRDLRVRALIGHLTEDRGALEAAWGGALAYDWYGVADTGIIGGEGPERDGLHVWEDAHYVEILDVDSHEAVPDGSLGDMVITCLFKHDLGPLIRFNTHDVTAVRLGANDSGLPFRRIEGFRGRSDNMVKLRGINVYPTAIAAMLEGRPGLTGEYYCRRERGADGSEMLTVVAEHDGSRPLTSADLTEALSGLLGVRVNATLVPPGSTAEMTGLLTRQKPIRLIDAR